MSRPEHLAPASVFYSATEALKYSQSSRIRYIQAELAERCLELLNLPRLPPKPKELKSSPPISKDAEMQEDGEGGAEEIDEDEEMDVEEGDEEEDEEVRYKPSLLLDIGCGSGLSGDILTDGGHEWVGVDISGGMLEVALENEVTGDLFLQDIGQGFGFRPGVFDGAISVSCVQWLCTSDTSTSSPPQRLSLFFTTLYSSLKRGARAVLQFYPENDEQCQFIMGFAEKAGFGGGLVVDYPESSKRRKYYLVLWAGVSETTHALPQALSDVADSRNEGERVKNAGRQRDRERRLKVLGKGKAAKSENKDRDWILRKEGVPRDSKYTGRKRKVAF
ncbi:S-adenosyl-L-methionine-dependent methyltransferase [Atractiella rhizophila]|nr:S-adenosyl-L-methionine-dependent methyltransferase [Atractiella rhizophila]